MSDCYGQLIEYIKVSGDPKLWLLSWKGCGVVDPCSLPLISVKLFQIRRVMFNMKTCD